MSPISLSSSKAPQLALVLITMIWGGTFLTVQYALNFTSPMFFVGCRFAVAALTLLLISFKSMKGVTLKDLGAGSVIGLVIVGGYGTQTIGLQTIPSSESAFLTALYVPLVPILMWLIFRKTPHAMTWVGAALAFTGLVLLTGNGFEQISLSFGQLLTVLGSLAIALEIIFISYFAGKVNLRRVTIIQLAVSTFVCRYACGGRANDSSIFMAACTYSCYIRFSKCTDSICDELGSAYGRSFTCCDYLCRRTCLGGGYWPNRR